MAKVDYKKILKEYYLPPAARVTEIDVLPMNYFMVDGAGAPDPASPDFSQAIEALFTLSYTLKFMVKKREAGIDYTVMPLEGLWWADDMGDFIEGNRERWQWTLMIMQPQSVTADLVEEALAKMGQSKKLPARGRLRFESLAEGRCAQILHIGPFAEEGPTVEKVHAFIREKGHELAGKHHEIYLSDFRRTAPAKLKTVIRQPMA